MIVAYIIDCDVLIMAVGSTKAFLFENWQELANAGHCVEWPLRWCVCVCVCG